MRFFVFTVALVSLFSFSISGVSASDSDSARYEKEAYRSDDVVFFLNDICIVNRDKGMRSFMLWAKNKLFLIAPSVAIPYMKKFGFEDGHIWTPGRNISNVFISKNHKSCKISGSIPDLGNLLKELNSSFVNDVNNYREFWNKAPLEVEAEVGEGRKLYIHAHSDNSLIHHYIIIQTYLENKDINFSITYRSKETQVEE